MNSKILIVAICLAVCVAAINADKGKEGRGGGKGGKKEMKCRGEKMEKDEEMMANMQACRKESKARKGGDTSSSGSDDDDQSAHKGGKGHHKMDPCFSACLMGKQGLVDSNGKYDVTKAKKNVENSKMPKDAKDSMIAALDKCAEEHAGTLSMDDNCKSYEGISKCTMGAMMKACHPEGH